MKQNIKEMTHEQLLKEWEVCQEQWGRLSSDCFGFYMTALHKEIVSRGGWPVKGVRDYGTIIRVILAILIFGGTCTFFILEMVKMLSK